MNRPYYIIYLRFYYNHLIDTSAGGLLVPESIICQVVSVSALLDSLLAYIEDPSLVCDVCDHDGSCLYTRDHNGLLYI